MTGFVSAKQWLEDSPSALSTTRTPLTGNRELICQQNSGAAQRLGADYCS
jgi:hypothetical protein